MIMKKYIAIATMAMALAACSGDDNTTPNDGQEPMVLTAQGIDAATATRATIDGDWKDVTAVGVQVGTEVKAYAVTPSADNKQATLTCANDPYYWTSRSEKKTITAWAPYTQGETTMPALTVPNDQSTEELYKASDYIAAVGKEVAYGDPKLTFSHRTSKLHIALTDNDGTTALTAATALTVSLDGGTTPIKAYNPGAADWYALVAPATLAAGKLKVTFTYGGKTYAYTHTAAHSFEAGKQHTFALKLAKSELVLSGCTIADWEEAVNENNTALISHKVDASGVYHIYTYEGLKKWAENIENSAEQKFGCVLEEDITMPAVGTFDSNWTPITTFAGTFDGKGHTIYGLQVKYSGGGFISSLTGTVKNLTLKDPVISDSEGDILGALAGHCNGGNIYCCQVIGGMVYGKDYVGGLVGKLSGGKIYGCSVEQCQVCWNYDASGNLVGDHNGGLIGYSAGGTVTSCWVYCRAYSYDWGGNHAIRGSASIGGTYTHCYWGYDYDNRLGSNVGTKVDGMAVTWPSAVETMNTNLPGECEYMWEMKENASLPSLVKK